jgi:hypothetical protein
MLIATVFNMVVVLGSPDPPCASYSSADPPSETLHEQLELEQEGHSFPFFVHKKSKRLSRMQAESEFIRTNKKVHCARDIVLEIKRTAAQETHCLFVDVGYVNVIKYNTVLNVAILCMLCQEQHG